MLQLLKTYLPYLLVIIVTVIILKSCQSDTVVYSKPTVIYKKIIKWEKQVDSTKAQVKKDDSVHTKLIIKWRIKAADTIYKVCDSLIIVCNDIITVDSTEINSLKHINNLQDSIITDQKVSHYNDSLEIKGLKKEIKRQKWQKRGVIAAWTLREGATLLK